MELVMGIVSFLFSFKGRIGRVAYLLSIIGQIIVFALLLPALGIDATSIRPESGDVSATGVMRDAMPGLSAAIIGLTLSLATLWISLATGAKRLHDLNKSGWWMFASIGLTIVSLIVGMIIPPLALFGTIAAGGLGLWVMIMMLFFKGDSGSNDYGSPPTVMKDIMGAGAGADTADDTAADMGASRMRLASPLPKARAAAATTTVTRVARAPKLAGGPPGAAPAGGGFGRRTR
jgi:uncharacterized membrane protein YhaH (DUF805 family)